MVKQFSDIVFRGYFYLPVLWKFEMQTVRCMEAMENMRWTGTQRKHTLYNNFMAMASKKVLDLYYTSTGMRIHCQLYKYNSLYEESQAADVHTIRIWNELGLVPKNMIDCFLNLSKCRLVFLYNFMLIGLFSVCKLFSWKHGNFHLKTKASNAHLTEATTSSQCW